VADRLKPGGAFRLATDWEPYAEWMRDVLAAQPRLSNATPDDRSIAVSTRGITRFEARGRRLGHAVFDFCLVRI
jgi:tRNA (guanine-N7-)-methyltransferase